MDLATDLLLINLGYALMLVALLMRDILWLRIILIVAQSTLGIYGLMIHNAPVAAWNFIFVGLNVARAVRLLGERRPIHLPRDQ